MVRSQTIADRVLDAAPSALRARAERYAQPRVATVVARAVSAWASADTYATLSDLAVWENQRKGVPGAAQETARRVADYRARLFSALSDADFADWYRLRAMGRQPWPLRSARDFPYLIEAAWAEDARARGVPVDEDSGVARTRAAEALADRFYAADRARREAARPRTPKELAVAAIRTASAEMRAWQEGKAAWLKTMVHPVSDLELEKWAQYRTLDDYTDALAKMTEELAEAREWEAKAAAKKATPSPEYRYGAMNRPPGLGSAPSGFLRIEPPLYGVGEINERMTRHGVLVYPRPLTMQEQKDWELFAYMPADEIAHLAVAKAIEDGHGPDYGEYIRAHGPDDEQAQQQVWDTIRSLRVYTDRPWQPITRAVLVELARRFP